MKSSTRLMVILLVFSLVPMSLLAYFAYVNGVRSLKDASRDHLIAVCELKAKDLVQSLGADQRALEDVAGQSILRSQVRLLTVNRVESSDGTAARELLTSSVLTQALSHPGFTSLAVLDPNEGRILASANWSMAATAYLDTEFFLAGKIESSVTAMTVDGDEAMLHLSTPITSLDGQLIGVLVAHGDVGQIQATMELGGDDHYSEDAYLVNQAGAFITRPRFAQSITGSLPIRSQGISAALEGNTGVAEYLDYRGIPVLGAYRALPELGLALINEIDLQETLAPIATLRRSIAAVVSVAVAAIVVVSLLVSRGMTNRLNQLTRAAVRVGEGDLDVQVPLSGHDEVGQLAGAFNAMTKSLKRVTTSHAELDREIQRREELEQERQKQWHRFTAILASYPDLFYVADPHTYEILFVNRVAEDVLGHNPVGELCHKAFQGLDEPCSFCTNHIIQEERVPYEWQHYNPALQKHFWITDQIIRWPDGRDVRFEVAKDITRYVQAQQERDIALAENAAIVKAMRDGLVIVSLDGDVIDVNDAFVTMSGYSRDEILKAARHEMLRRMFDADDADLYLDALRLAVKGQVPDPAVVRLNARSGAVLTVSATASLLEGHGGGGVLVSLKDITPLKEAEEALRASEAKYRALFEKAQIGMFRSRIDGSGLLDVNARLCEIFERSEEEMLEMSTSMMWADPEVRDEVVRRLDVDGRVTDIEAEILTGQGKRKTVLGAMTLYRDEGILEGSAMDITERRQAQHLVERMNDELKRSNQELEQFAYVASHDLQEPLRMVASYTQLLERRYKDQLDDDAKDFIHYAVDGANRMQRLINDLLDYSRVQTRGRAFEPTDMNVVLGHARVNLAAAIEESKAIVTNDDLPTIPVDAMQMTSLLQNLIGNAIKFRGPERPWVHVRAKECASAWEFSVKDNGIGIDPQFHERVFAIFQRLHGRTEYSGTGIGLSLCKRIAERHGGRIWLESTPGDGAEFFFTISKEGGA